MDLVGVDAAARRKERREALAERREAHARSRAAGAASPRRRRRGEELEDALLDATWDQLLQGGYDELTYERVAYRAGTSRSVVYRRWPSKRDLVLAAIAHEGAKHPPLEVPDTGSLRGDVLTLLRDFHAQRAEAVMLFGTQLGNLYREAGVSPALARESWIGDRASAAKSILDRAVARGEVDPARVTPRAVRVAGDLLRHDVMMGMGSVTDEAIVEIVDDVVVPLLTGRAPEPRPAASPEPPPAG